MNQSTLNQWLETFQQRVEAQISRIMTRQQSRVLEQAIGVIVERTKRADLTIYQAQRILDSYDLPEEIYDLAANISILASSVQLYMNNPKDRQIADATKHIRGMVQRNPQRTADLITRAVEKEPKWAEDMLLYLASGIGDRLRTQYKDSFKGTTKYSNRTVAREVRKDTIRSKKKERAEIAQRINDRWTKTRTVIVNGKEVKGKLTQAYARRHIESQVHNQMEAIKATEASVNGILFKQWMTEMDERVRITHRELHGHTIPINDNFIVNGFEASYPGDSRLPIGEKINCRCKLKYKNTLF